MSDPTDVAAAAVADTAESVVDPRDFDPCCAPPAQPWTTPEQLTGDAPRSSPAKQHQNGGSPAAVAAAAAASSSPDTPRKRGTDRERAVVVGRPIGVR